MFSKMQKLGDSVLLWGAISHHRVSLLIYIEGRQDSTEYLEVLRDVLLPSTAKVIGEGQDWSFQQGNAPIHTSKLAKHLSSHSITTLLWHPKYPDINIISKVWGVMARTVYA